jgi:hypothetical protein
LFRPTTNTFSDNIEDSIKVDEDIRPSDMLETFHLMIVLAKNKLADERFELKEVLKHIPIPFEFVMQKDSKLALISALDYDCFLVFDSVIALIHYCSCCT